MIEIGMTLLARARDLGATGPYQLKAAIAAIHARTARAELTDWGTIVRLYDRLLEWEPSPVVALNRAVAVAMDGGPEAGLELLGDPALSGPLADYHLFYSTRADLLRRSGRITEASTAYRQARDLTANATEQMFLDRRLAELRSMLDVTGVVLDCES
jgi:RNA polymerase sigma-70 factor (ECF subfamily)